MFDAIVSWQLYVHQPCIQTGTCRKLVDTCAIDPPTFNRNIPAAFHRPNNYTRVTQPGEPNEQSQTCTFMLAWKHIPLLHTTQTRLLIHPAGQTNRHKETRTHADAHRKQPSGSKFHFISRAGEEQAGESIQACSSCAEGGFAAIETDVALLQTAILIQSTGVNTHT